MSTIGPTGEPMAEVRERAHESERRELADSWFGLRAARPQSPADASQAAGDPSTLGARSSSRPPPAPIDDPIADAWFV